MAYTYPVAPVGAIFLTTFRMTFCGQRLINTYYHRVDANAGGLTINSLSDQMNTVFSQAGGLIPSHNALREVGCMLDRIDIQMIKPARYVQIPYVKTMPGTHTSTTGLLDTPNLAAVITRRGVNATRKGVGSVHIPIPLDVSVINEGELTGGYKALLTVHAAQMQADIAVPGNATLKPVIYNPTSQPDFSYIGAAFYQEYVRTMRRRTKGVGI